MPPRKLQQPIHEWADVNFPCRDLRDLGLLVCEEVGEMARVINKMLNGHRTTECNLVTLQEEMGDVVIALYDMAAYVGVDLQTVVEKRWEVVKERNFQLRLAGMEVIGDAMEESEDPV